VCIEGNLGYTYAELVEVELIFEVVDDDFTLVEDEVFTPVDVELVVALLELILVDVLIVDVDRVVDLVDVDVAPLAVAVADGSDPEGAP
jgi:hypothetical protein